MNKELTKVMWKTAFTGCALCTAIISVIIAYFLMRGDASYPFAPVLTDCWITALLTGVLVTFFGPLIAGSIKNLDQYEIGIAKKDHPIFKLIPNNLFLSAIVIGVLTAVPFGILPWLIQAVCHFDFTMGLVGILVWKGILAMAIAEVAAYLTIGSVIFKKANH